VTKVFSIQPIKTLPSNKTVSQSSSSPTPGPIDHNETLNKQGGDTDEYYHLTEEKYDIVSGLITDGQGDLFLSDDGTYKPVGGSGVVYIRRSDYTTLISYNGYALTGSLETDAVWTITKIVTDSAGDVISSVQTENYKWSERYSL
jgi:hypothetical protein